MDDRYLTAFLTPRKQMVAGVSLDTLCCRHMILLEAIRSPFISNLNGQPNVDDLVNAIRICSTKNWEEAVSEPSFFQKVKFNKLLIDADSLKLSFEQFQLYISESLSVPKVWTKDTENSKKINNSDEQIPSSLAIVVLLMTKFGFSESDAWSLPYCRAMWYSTAFSAQEGSEIKIITTDSEGRAEQDKKLLDEIENLARKDFKQNG